MEILTHSQIKQKIKRLAIEILEHNYDQKEIYLMGINNNGYRFAGLLQKEIRNLNELDTHLINVRLNAAKPLEQEVTLSIDVEKLSDKSSSWSMTWPIRGGLSIMRPSPCSTFFLRDCTPSSE